MSFKDQARRRRVAEKRGRRGNRRAQAMLLRQGVLHPVDQHAMSGANPSIVIVDEFDDLFAQEWEA